MKTPQLPVGYHKVPADYTGPLFLEGQLRQYAQACEDAMVDVVAEREKFRKAYLITRERLDQEQEISNQAKRLAFELECLLLSCTDTVATSKWWESANAALQEYQDACKEIYK